MARIDPVPEAADSGRPFSVVYRIRAHRPELAGAFASVSTAINQAGTLSRRLRELVRIRVAFHNQCRPCMSARYETDVVTEGLVCSLAQPAEAPDLTDAERAALRFADLFATDHLAIDDALYEELRSHFDDGELVELGLMCAYFVGAGRLTATWQVTDDVPESYLEEGRLTPWGHPDPVRMS